MKAPAGHSVFLNPDCDGPDVSDRPRASSLSPLMLSWSAFSFCCSAFSCCRSAFSCCCSAFLCCWSAFLCCWSAFSRCASAASWCASAASCRILAMSKHASASPNKAVADFSSGTVFTARILITLSAPQRNLALSGGLVAEGTISRLQDCRSVKVIALNLTYVRNSACCLAACAAGTTPIYASMSRLSCKTTFSSARRTSMWPL